MQEKRLSRKLGFFPATNIVIANMIGAGIFTTSGLLLADLKNPVLMIVLWLIGGIIAFCGAISYGELGANMPHAGGEYMFLSRVFHPILGFLSGWISFLVGFSAPIAASAIGFSEYFMRAFPNIYEIDFLSNIFHNEQSLIKILAVSLILVFTALHYRGLETGSKVQNVLTLLKIFLITGLIFFGLLSDQGQISHFHFTDNPTDKIIDLKTIGLSLMWIMFAYSGWNASTYIGSEIKNPEKNLPRSLLGGTIVVIILYIMLNIMFVFAIPPDEMKGVISVGGLAMKNLIGSQAEKITSILISIALFSSLSAFIIIGPRVYYAMSKDKLFFKSVSRIHPVFKVPSFSIALQGGIASIIVFSGTLEQILTYMGFSLGIFPILTVFATFKLRKTKNEMIKAPGFPWVQIIYMSTGIIILILAYMERPKESTIALFTLLTGVPAYFLFKKYR